MDFIERKRKLAEARAKAEHASLDAANHFAKLVADATKDGAEIVEFALGVMRATAKTSVAGEEFAPTIPERIQAAKFLEEILKGGGKTKAKKK